MVEKRTCATIPTESMLDAMPVRLTWSDKSGFSHTTFSATSIRDGVYSYLASTGLEGMVKTGPVKEQNTYSSYLAPRHSPSTHVSTSWRRLNTPYFSLFRGHGGRPALK